MAPHSTCDAPASREPALTSAAWRQVPDAPNSKAPPPFLPYKVDTSRPSLRTNWTRLVPFPQALDALDARVTALQRQLARDRAALSAGLRAAGAAARARLPGLVAGAEAGLDAQLQAGESKGAAEIAAEGAKAGDAARDARAAARGAEEALAQVLSSTEALWEEHHAAQQAAVEGANRTVAADAGEAAAAAQLLAPELETLQERLSPPPVVLSGHAASLTPY